MGESARLFQGFQGNSTPFFSCSTPPPTPELNLPPQIVLLPETEKMSISKIYSSNL